MGYGFSLYPASGLKALSGRYLSLDLNPVSDNLFDTGLLAEAGIGYTLGSGELLISARYQYSFTSLDRKSQKNQVHRYIDTLSITAGYSFSLGDKK